MKKVALILWIVSAVMLLGLVGLVYFHPAFITPLIINILALIFLFVLLTALFCTTVANKKKNPDKQTYVVKLSLIVCLYVLAILLFVRNL